MADRVPLFGTGPKALSELLGGTGRAREVWRVIRDGGDPFADAELGEKALHRLRERCHGATCEVADRRVSEDGTRKLLVGLAGGDRVETVVIPGRGRTTVCVSTQVGCARQCTFCVTATMGLVRSLHAGEIVEQVLLARTEALAAGLPPLRNVVFMGMGEPLDNLDATLTSIGVLTDPHGLAIPPRHVTLSTVGTSPRAIRRLAELHCSIAWSLHSVDAETRRALVPTDKHPLEELRDAFVEVTRDRNDVLFVEMTLLEGVNDGEQDARALADFLVPFLPKVRVNLLPMNPGRTDHRPSPDERAEAMQAVLREHGIFCMLRRARGVDAAAACGQLATEG